MKFRETKRVLLVVDLAGYSRATAGLAALSVAAFLDDWYRQAAEAIRSRGGRVVKFMGDACLATFPEDAATQAVDAATSVRGSIGALCERHRLKVDVGANIHLAIVAEGDFGPEDDARYDILGSGVNHLFMMGGAAGIRISEPVFRALPNDQRGVWDKQRPPATYSMSE